MATLTGSSSCRPSCDFRQFPSSFSLPRQCLSFPRRSYSTGCAVSKRGALFCVKAMEISGPGSIESTLMISMSEKLKEQLNTSDVVVKDAYGDGRHVSIEVISPEFEGKSSVNRQRMVYKAIWEELQSTVHAVDSMRTLTPEEASLERSKPSS